MRRRTASTASASSSPHQEVLRAEDAQPGHRTWSIDTGPTISASNGFINKEIAYEVGEIIRDPGGGGRASEESSLQQEARGDSGGPGACVRTWSPLHKRLTRSPDRLVKRMKRSRRTVWRIFAVQTKKLEKLQREAHEEVDQRLKRLQFDAGARDVPVALGAWTSERAGAQGLEVEPAAGFLHFSTQWPPDRTYWVNGSARLPRRHPRVHRNGLVGSQHLAADLRN